LTVGLPWDKLPGSADQQQSGLQLEEIECGKKIVSSDAGASGGRSVSSSVDERPVRG
jgi:hypothetical protein